MLTPHFHARAVNWVVAISGNTTTYMYEENGAHTITTHLDFGKATLFPRGSVHAMVNEGMLSMPSVFDFIHTIGPSKVFLITY